MVRLVFFGFEFSFALALAKQLLWDGVLQGHRLASTAKELLQAMAYLHGCWIVHRDLKPALGLHFGQLSLRRGSRLIVTFLLLH